MPVPVAKSQTIRSDGNQTSDSGDIRAHWFLISEISGGSLRIKPGLHIGESTEGELSICDESSSLRWLAFRSENDGVWLEAASDGIQLSNEETGRLERHPLLPGLVLALPHNRLLISQDSLISPAPELVISVHPQSSGHIDGDISRAKAPPEMGEPTLERVNETFPNLGSDRFRPVVALALLSLLMLIASPLIVNRLEHKPSVVVDVDLPPAAREPPEQPFTGHTSISETASEPAVAINRKTAQLRPSVARPQTSPPVDDLPAVASAIAGTTVVEKSSIASFQLFGFDSAKLSDAGKTVVDEHIQALTDGKTQIVITRVEGHTDSTGPATYNLYLSQLRAQAVADYIESQGYAVKDSGIEAVGRGESEPVATNYTRTGRAENRRVSVFAQRAARR
jgi:outer membrane protein OmpA-like peptidoglycan-associated protein